MSQACVVDKDRKTESKQILSELESAAHIRRAAVGMRVSDSGQMYEGRYGSRQSTWMS